MSTTIQIPTNYRDVVLWRWPDVSEGFADGQYEFAGTADPDVVLLTFHGPNPPPWTADTIADARQSPEWLAYRKRQMLDSAPETIGAPLDDAWKRLAPIINADPTRLSAANNTRRQADLDVLAAALSGAETAISTAPDIDAAEAAGAAVTAPVYQGPEVVA